MTQVTRFPLAALLLCACGTTRAVAPARSLNTDTPAVCASHCEAMGMRLSAVVIIAGSEGCVCEPRDTARSSSRDAAPTAITPILAAAAAATAQQRQEEERRRQQQHRQQPIPPSPTPNIGR